jgi:hypothetical protein
MEFTQRWQKNIHRQDAKGAMECKQVYVRGVLGVLAVDH